MEQSFFLNWGIVDLQYCVSDIQKMIQLYMYIYIFFWLYSLEVIIEFPVLYSKSLLHIYFMYSSLYLLIPYSQ